MFRDLWGRLSGLPKKIVISGYYGFNNLGDEATLSAILQSFRSSEAGDRGKDFEITVLSGNPDSTAKGHSVKAVHRANLLNIVKSLWGADLLISGGGSLLQDVTSQRSLLYYLGIVGLGKILSSKAMLYAQGVGPLRSWISRLLVRLICNRVDLITLRDEESKNLLQRLGVTRPPIYVTADPTFALKATEPEKCRQYLMQEGLQTNGKPLIGICLRKWSHLENLKAEMAQICEWLRDNLKSQILFIPMQFSQDKDLSEEMAKRTNSKVLSREYPPADLMGLIGLMDLVIAMRLHALMFAAAQGVPFVGISYDPKVDQFVRAFDLEPPPHIEHLRSGELLEKVKRTWDSRAEIRTQLLEKRAFLKEKALENAKYALRLAES